VLTEQRSMLHAKLLAELSRKERLPVLHSFSEGVHAGGLISYGLHQPEMVSIAAGYVAKILKGEKPADMPVEQPTQFELVLNLKTAREIGLTVPPTLSEKPRQTCALTGLLASEKLEGSSPLRRREPGECSGSACCGDGEENFMKHGSSEYHRICQGGSISFGHPG